MSERPHLRALADRVGIISAYHDLTGIERVTTDETRERLLTAMGFAVSTESSTERAIEQLSIETDGRLLGFVHVVEAGSQDNVEIPLRDAYRDGEFSDGDLTIIGEDGSHHSTRAEFGAAEGGSVVRFFFPAAIECGYYRTELQARRAGQTIHASQTLVVAPSTGRGLGPGASGARSFGIWANLYSIRSRHNWGIGDCTDLGRLIDAARDVGAAFVGVNPLHTLRNCGDDVSPYAPVTRLFRNPIYLDVEKVPEFSGNADARPWIQSVEVQAELARLRSLRHVDYAGVAALKMSGLRILYDDFCTHHRNRGTPRGLAYAAFLKHWGELLSDFATFMVISDVLGERDVSRWPSGLGDPASADVAKFRAHHENDVDFHCFLQFELDRQLGAAAMTGGGLSLGLYHDLAIGSSGDGFDAWKYPNLFACGVEIGAPPDPYSATGQAWGIPPVIPHRLTDSAYGYWIGVLRSAMAHAGMLRIDHVMGLFRQFWVPSGMTADQGAYVRYPTNDLLGILMLESQRNNVVIVGEDLGTVPPEVPREMTRRGILSTRAMWFERDGDSFRGADGYSSNALVTTTTHDLAPLAGLLGGRDIDIRQSRGLYDSVAQAESAREERARVRSALYRRLRESGFLSDDDPEFETVLLAVHALLHQTPAALIGISLDDIAGETDPVNLPGVGPKVFSSWTRRMQRTLEAIVADPAFVRIMSLFRREDDGGGVAY